jgi:AmpE protein
MPDPMAKTLIAILIVLLSTHALPDLARFRGFSWLRGWLVPADQQGNNSARTLVITGLMVVVTALIQAFLHRHWFGLLELAFMVIVLYFSWGPRDGISEEPVPFSAAALVEAGFSAALSRRFGVLFWFALLGPVGALGYRLVQLLARSPGFAAAAGNMRPTFERTALILDWAPAHVLVWTLALVSDFDATVRAWREYHLAHGQGYFTLDLGFVGFIARADVDADVAAGDEGDEGVGNPLTELADARVILRRVLYVWIAVIAVVVLGGWAS